MIKIARKSLKTIGLNLTYYIAKRYFFTKNSQNAINIISKLSMVGVVVTTLGLTLVLSIFSGLKEYTLDYTDKTTPDLRIVPSKGTTFKINDKILNTIRKTKGVLNYSQIISQRCFLRYQDREAVSNIIGVDSLYHQVIDIQSQIYSGTWLAHNTRTAVVSSNIGYKLQATTSSSVPLQVYVPYLGKRMLLQQPFKRVALQPVGFIEEQSSNGSGIVYTSLTNAQKLLQKKADDISAIDIRINPKAKEKEVVQRLKQTLGEDFLVKTKMSLHNLFYKILNTERMIAYLVCTLAIIITLFNVFGVLTMIIIDKKRNLLNLVNMGMRVRQIKKIFQAQGMLFCLFGMVIGLVLAGITIALQSHYGFVKLNPYTPYPICWDWKNTIIIVFTMTLLPWGTVWLASKKVHRVISDSKIR